jgi:hypothetical protein
MSNKKRRNQKAASAELNSGSSKALVDQANVVDETRSSLNGSEDQTTRSGQTGSSNGARVLSYLKAHLWMMAAISFLTLGALGAGLKYLDEDARRELAKRADNKGNLNNQDQSFLNRVNPFLPTPTPSPTPQLSKSYIYAGSRLLAVEDANAVATPPADLAIWRPTTGYWWVMNPNGNVQAQVGWGLSGDQTVPGDYDGDGKTDFSVYRPATSTASAVWWILKSSTQDTSSYSVPFGAVSDLPAPADYDGDGKTDIAVYRPSTGVWFINQSSTGTNIYPQFGNSSDIPAAADYDGDGRADLAVWRNSGATFYSANSSNGQIQTHNFGSAGDVPVCADYDGDGKADIAVWRNGNASWYIEQSSNGSTMTTQWGTSGDKTVRNDYDGDGKVDIAVWRNSNGTWYIKNSADNSTRTVQWGAPGDTPVPAYYRR